MEGVSTRPGGPRELPGGAEGQPRRHHLSRERVVCRGDPQVRLARLRARVRDVQPVERRREARGRDRGRRGGNGLNRASAPFEEHWRHRHLLDMDGAGFSGRFIPFLESHSLPHRAALFLAWFDERLQEWQHYVPVDTRLGRGFWAVLDFLSSSEVVVDDAGFRQTGDEMAERIAEQGRDWAKRALRKEDMQIYMFRLLLEYGRVVSDDREALAYTGTGIPDW
uniref:Glycosyl transferase CAP10 domain-containing protein n=1 Tax=Bionectria ochroleuca TaxID=29856 RepID=A0A8H7N3E4_BIOOC